MTLTREILVCLLLIAGAAVLVQSALFVGDCRGSAQASTKAVQGIDLLRITVQAQLTGKYGLLSEATAAARESRKTIDVIQRTSLNERSKVAAFSAASIAAVQDLSKVARSGSAAVEELRTTVAGIGSLAPALRRDSEAVGGTIEAATELLRTLDAGAKNTLDRSTETLSNVNALVVAAAPIEEHALSTSRHIDDGAKALSETLAFLREDFAPHKKSFWMKLGDIATNGLFSMLFHLWPAQRVRTVH